MSQDNGSIIGRILSVDNKPIKDAVVFFTRDSPTHNDIAASTDDKGQFVFHGLTPGDYSLLVNAENFSQKILRIRVNEGKETPVNVVLK